MHWFTNLKHNKFILLTVIILCTGTSTLNAQIQESFDNVAGLEAAGWIFDNYSDTSADHDNWYQGDGSVFPAHSGGGSSYIAYSTEGVTNIVCNWLVMPDVGHIDQLSFYARTPGFSKIAPVVSLYVLYSPTGSTNTGSCETASRGGGGDFELLLEINQTQDGYGFPTDWTEFTVDVNGTGRIAFVYYVQGVGEQTFDASYLGIDSINRGGTLPPVVQSVPSLNIIGLLALILVMMIVVYINRKNLVSIR